MHGYVRAVTGRSPRLSPLLEEVLDEIERLRGVRKMTKSQLAADAGISTQAMDRWEEGSSPGLDTLEMVSKALSSQLVVRFVDLSAPAGTVDSTTTGDETLTDDMMHLFSQIDDLPDPQRSRIMGRIEGMLSEMKSRPPEPIAHEKGPRDRAARK